MQVFKDGKEVKNGKVIYDAWGTPETVRIDGIHYAASAFEFKEPKVETKTKGSEEKQDTKPVKKVVKKSKK